VDEERVTHLECLRLWESEKAWSALDYIECICTPL
jgi:hypothetical protein